MALRRDLASKGVLDLALLPELTSEGAARRFGLYPHKGVISIGSDADLEIVDHRKEWVIEAVKLQAKAWECVLHDGMKVNGRVKYTLLRGDVIYDDGAGFAKPGYGKMIKGTG